MRYFFIAFFLVFLSLLVYVFVRGGQALRDVPAGRTAFYVSVSLFAAAMFAGVILSVFTDFAGIKILAFVGYSALIVFVYLILSFFLADIVRLILHFCEVSATAVFAFRKYFFLLSLAAITVSMIAGYVRYRNPSVAQLDITAQTADLQGKTLKIVAASDLHLGVSNDKGRLQEFVSVINAQHPDIVLLAGDICDNNLAPLVTQKMDEELRNFHAPMGIFAVTGNHEYIGGNVDKTVEFYRNKCNFTVLRDETVQIDSALYIAGRDDYSNRNRKALSKIVGNISAEAAVILLDHQPQNLHEAVENNIALQISGHTHDGQFFPINLITRAIFEKSQGYLQKNSTQFYIMSGLGIWGPPYRIGTKSELLVIDFHF